MKKLLALAITAAAITAGGAHADHHPVLTGLAPDTVYYLRLQGVGPDGTLYRGEEFTFRTLPGAGAFGAANLAADGMSMGVGNLLAIRAEERARETDGLPELEAYPWKHGMATLLAFITAGTVPLVPYLLPFESQGRLALSTGMTFGSLFLMGALRALITRDRWWRTGLETLLLGAVVALAAYGAGLLVAAVQRAA